MKCNFTGSGYFKALLGAGVGFNLWHFIKNLFLHPAGASELTENLWSLMGNMFYKETVETKHRNSKRGAKV
ncbi:MAG: hypothetical protein M3Z92_05775, partial [Bacteroidota bacterium]|nr:hypothetical protein [Bacteroidota bacterium]